ncbi:MAG: PTS sugar transporter subunit IIA [Promethearchaeota archaeon]
MNVVDYLTPENILLDLKAQNKEGAIKEIILLLKNRPEVSNFEMFLQDIFEREKLASTGIGNGVALPHARTDAVDDFVIAFGRSKKGIEFDSIDGQKAKIIFVMGTPRKKGLNLYLRILTHINRLLKKEAFRSSLMDASSFKDIIHIFNQVEKMFYGH